ncbi:DNA-3-methyladenine glycosylase family protein [Phycicoccus sonneratiae]|uniref:DNA-3-methyladenine glycosylase II n=1 Tax=Phycicoccus sonneratiae TaxID=2807628 RepID=A0ABS2CG78_9MICO|nr:DNA-3-methyladenine glycosylase 2 family protein [Phycicoccus sonneraticus]MBM6398881.1 DNA-3-methyladenine glycosylase 2 family protein [Phycicoccus sonneraticus]
MAEVGERVEEVVREPVDVPALRAWLVAHGVPAVDEVVTAPSGATTHRRDVRGVGPVAVDLPTDGAPRLVAPDAAGLQVLRRWLGLDHDPTPGVAALADDPVLGPLVRARPHVRVPGTPDPFEAAVNVVLGQHVSLAAGRVFAGRLAAAHPVTPEALAALDPEVLRADVGVTGARARTLVALARAVLDGLELTPQPDPDAGAATRAALLALPGVGPWTADLVMMRCLRDPDVFLPGDLVLRKALGGVTAREAARRAEAWAPHRSLAVAHLWTHHALDPR